MPVIIITPSKAKPTAVQKYIMRADKTRDDLKFSQGCSPDSFDQDFVLMHRAYDKCHLKHNVKYYHFKISWHPDDHVPASDAKEMLKEFCKATNLVGCQYAGSVHIDSNTTHGHIVVNNVRMYDSEYGKAGYCYSQNPKCRRKMMDIMNQITLDHGYTHSIVDYTKHAKERLSYGEKELIKKGKLPWKEELRLQIQDGIQQAISLETFKEYMQNAYKVIVKERKNHLMYFTEAMSNQDRGCPARRLGDAYDKELIETEITKEHKMSLEFKDQQREGIEYGL